MTDKFKNTLLLITAPFIAWLSFPLGQHYAQYAFGFSEPIVWLPPDYVGMASLIFGSLALTLGLIDLAVGSMFPRKGDATF